MSKPIDQELLPCPFCGDKAEVYEVADGQCYVACVNDECNGQNGYESSMADAVKRWNRRAAVQPAGVAVPEGWKMVPAAVTGRIVLAMERNGVPDGTDTEMLWYAMLAAAPHPASGEQTVASVSIGVDILKWWRQLVDLNPADLAPRLDAALSAHRAQQGEQSS